MKKVREASKILEKNQSDADNNPTWWDGKRLDEIGFCRWLLAKHHMVHVGHFFYDIDGYLSDKKISKEILDAIEPYVKSSLSSKVKRIKEVLELKSMEDRLPTEEDRVHFSNGTYYLDGGFVPEKQFCSNRLPTPYNADAKEPVRWLEFVNQLLYEDDIITLQEFMGYCMIPTTKAQAMLLLIGNGGEGKSRVGLVMRSILGDNMNICSIDKLSQDRFCRADQEGKLLMVDDDSQMEALKNTNILKAVITMEDKMDLETKGMKSYQGYLYVRIMAFGNGSLTSLYDASDGFYRRQIVLKVRDKNPNRKDDKDLAKKLREENEGIALWALEGLNRLAVNGFHFTVSDRALQNMEDNKKSDVNLLQFIESEGYLHFQSDGEITTKEFYEIYMQWCEDNLEKPRAQNTFSSYFKDHGREYGLTEKKNVKNNGGKYVRGFKGVCKHIGPNPFENAA